MSFRRWTLSWVTLWTLSLTFLIGLTGLQRDAAAVLKQDAAAQKTAYVTDHLIVKYKDTVTECVHCLLKAHGRFKDVTADHSDSLDQLHARFHVGKATPVFRTEEDEHQLGQGRRLNLVDLKQQDQNRFAQAKQKFVQRSKRAPKDGEHYKLPSLHHVYTLTVPLGTNIEEAVAAFSADPNVEYAQPDYLVEANWVPDDPYYSSSGSWGQPYDDLWGLKKIDAEEAWDITKGEGVVVAIVDSGIDYTHPDLAENIWTNPHEIPGNGIDDDHNGYVDDIRG